MKTVEYIGVDIAKAKFDAVILNEKATHKIFNNNKIRI
jgi:hypothetical protein